VAKASAATAAVPTNAAFKVPSKASKENCAGQCLSESSASWKEKCAKSECEGCDACQYCHSFIEENADLQEFARNLYLAENCRNNTDPGGKEESKNLVNMACQKRRKRKQKKIEKCPTSHGSSHSSRKRKGGTKAQYKSCVSSTQGATSDAIYFKWLDVPKKKKKKSTCPETKLSCTKDAARVASEMGVGMGAKLDDLSALASRVFGKKKSKIIRRRIKGLRDSYDEGTRACWYPACGCPFCVAPVPSKQQCYDCTGSLANREDNLVPSLYHSSPCRTSTAVPTSISQKLKTAVATAQSTLTKETEELKRFLRFFDPNQKKGSKGDGKKKSSQHNPAAQKAMRELLDKMDAVIAPLVHAYRTLNAQPKEYCTSCHTHCGDILQILRFNKDKPEEASGRCLHAADQNTVKDPGCNGICIAPDGSAADPVTSTDVSCSMACRYSGMAQIKSPSKELKAIGVAPGSKVAIFCDMAKRVTCSGISAAAQEKCRAEKTSGCPKKTCAVKKSAKCVKICKLRPSWLSLQKDVEPKLDAWLQNEYNQLENQAWSLKNPAKKARKLRTMRGAYKSAKRKYIAQADGIDLAKCIDKCSDDYCEFTVTMR